MAYEFYNPNPDSPYRGDCVIRALCKALDKPWEYIYVELCVQGFAMHDLPNSDTVWGSYLRSKGFERFIVPNTCPDCYTISDFAADHPAGTYVLGTGTHAVTIRDGIIYDTMDTSNEIPIYYYSREE